MALSGTDVDYKKINGRFKEREYGHVFEYTNDPQYYFQFDKDRGATHRVFVGGIDNKEMRPIKVLKTVAYIATGETEELDGYVWKKWHIKHLWTRTLHQIV